MEDFFAIEPWPVGNLQSLMMSGVQALRVKDAGVGFKR